MTNRLKIWGTAGVIAAAAFLGASAAQASTWVATGTNEGNAVSATAEIDLTGGLLTVDLTNTTDDMRASNQAISGIFLTFDVAPTSGSGFTQDGDLVNLNGTTNSGTAAAGDPTHWAGTLLGTGVIRLWTLTGGQPRNMIASGDLGDLNNGISNFNPYIDETGHFTFNLGGLATKVTAVSFLYGTNPNNPQVGGECTANCGGGGGGQGVPEPATWALMILGFGGAGAMLRRRREALA
jgi:hypothetical protein